MLTGAAVALLAVAVAITTCVPGRRRARRGYLTLHRLSPVVLRAIGIRRNSLGAPRSGPSLVVGNHVSWLDILVLAGEAPMRHVGKSEIAQWPLVGWIARRSGVLFHRRHSLRELPGLVDQIATALRRGDRIQVFPEATTRCGDAVNQFHRAAFQAAIDAAVVVSPVAVAYRSVNGEIAHGCSFVGDETFVKSFRRVIAAKDVTVSVKWLRPIPAMVTTGVPAVDRAVVARLAETAVAETLGAEVVGRDLAAGWLDSSRRGTNGSTELRPAA